MAGIEIRQNVRVCRFSSENISRYDEQEEICGQAGGWTANSHDKSRLFFFWRKCRITDCFMELWVTLFAGRGKAALCFSTSCE